MNVKPKLLIKPEFGADVCLNCFISTIKDKKKTLHYGNHQTLLESKNNSNH